MLKASVISEKYTPLLLRRMRAPTTRPSTAVATMPSTIGRNVRSGNRWICSSAAVYAPKPKNNPWPKDNRPVCPSSTL